MKPVLRSNLFFLIIMIIMIAGSIVLGIAVSVLSFGLHVEVPMYVLLLLTEIVFLLIPSIVYLIITKQSFKETFRLNPLDWKSGLLIIGIILTIEPFFMFLASITSLIFPNDVQELLENLNTLPLWLMLFVMAVTPAICEEITIRGVVLSGYKNIDLKKAALINGLIFGLFHLNPSQFLYTVFAGILFVYLIEITGTLHASILAHFTLNGSQVLYSRFAMWVAEMQNINMNDVAAVTLQQQLLSIFAIFILALLFAPIAFLFFYLLMKINHKTKQDLQLYHGDKIALPEQVTREKVMNWPLYACIGVYIFYVGITELVKYLSTMMISY